VTEKEIVPRVNCLCEKKKEQMSVDHIGRGGTPRRSMIAKITPSAPREVWGRETTRLERRIQKKIPAAGSSKRKN